MSIAVLARKTKEKNNRKRCPLILNMTGRGGGIGRYSFAGKSSSSKNGCLGSRCSVLNKSCCNNETVVSNSYNYDKTKTCNYNGLSQPAPQMSYRTYLNKKSAGAYRPGSKICCDKPDCKTSNDNATLTTNGPCGGTDKINCGDESGMCISRCKSQNTVKRVTPLTNEEINEIRKQQLERQYQALNTVKCDSNSAQGSTQGSNKKMTDTCRLANSWDDRMKYHVLRLKQKPRLSYTRINIRQCTTTKPMGINQTASDVIQRRKAEVYKQKCSAVEKRLLSEGSTSKIRTYCDCEKEFSGHPNKINECKMLLAKLDYPKLENSMQKISDGCSTNTVTNSKQTPCNIDGVTQSN